MAEDVIFPSSELLSAVKLYLNITWDDNRTNSKVIEWLRQGKYYIDKKNGEPADYDIPGSPRTLLMEYARYARDGALDVFENNYRAEILSMQLGRLSNDESMESPEPPSA